MKSLVLALTLVLCASSLHGGHSLAADYGLLGKGMDSQGQRTGRSYQFVVGPKEGSPAADRSATEPRLTHINAGESTGIAFAPQGLAVASEKPVVNAGWSDCKCKDCKCATEEICKAGDCQKNYVMLATAKWCKHCPRQKANCEQLRKEGYIVHVVDYDTHKDKLQALGIVSLPTTLVFKDGKVDKFFGGVTSPAEIKKGLLTKAEQDKKPDEKPDNKPKRPDYNFR